MQSQPDSPAEADEERITHDWTIFGFGELFPSLVATNRNGKRVVRVDKEKQQNAADELELISQEFMCGQLVKKTAIWEMELRIKGGNLSVALSCVHCFHDEVNEIWTRFDADIVDFHGRVLHSEGGGTYYNSENLTKFTPRAKIGDRREARLNDRNSFWETDIVSKLKLSKNWKEFVPRNILNLRLKLCVFREKPLNEARFIAEYQEPVKLCFTDNSIFQAVKRSNDFLQAIENLWHTMEGSDMVFSIDGVILRAHKFIVAVQSPVLKKMIAARENSSEGTGHDGESRTTIDLSGHHFQAFKILLKYIYTQDAVEVKASTDSDFISSVLETCNRFEVKSLARICLVRLLTNMTVENFNETALAVYRNVSLEESFFKTEIKRFLMENQSALQESTQFKEYAKTHPNHFLELCFEPLLLLVPPTVD